MFRIGDKIVHPMHGAGVVDAIIQKKVGGVVRDYYILKLPVGGMVVMIPTASSDAIGVRPIVNAQQAEAVIHAIPDLEIEIISNWNQRYRENLSCIKSGNLMEVARVIKGLCHRDKIRGLSTGERKLLHSARQILISELVLAQDSTYEEVEGRINAVLDR